MRWKSQRCCINNYDYDGLGEIPIRDFVCWDLFLVNWMELMIMRMEAMTISQFRPNFTISYWTCWGKEWKMKTVADKREKLYCHQHQHVNPIWWESWSRGLVNWAQTFWTRSLPILRVYLKFLGLFFWALKILKTWNSLILSKTCLTKARKQEIEHK